MAWRRLKKQLGPVGILGLLWLLIPLGIGLVLVAKIATVANFLSLDKTMSAPVWTLLMALLIGVGLLPVYSNTFLCGWVFGWGVGLLSAIVSYLLAATLGFYLARRLSFTRVNEVIESYDTSRRVRHALLFQNRRRALLIVTLWRLSGAPFPLTNLVMASCGVPVSTYLLGTLLGLGPRAAIGALVAATAASTGARDIQTLVRSTTNPLLLLGGALASVVTFLVIGHVARAALRRVTDETVPSG